MQLRKSQVVSSQKKAESKNYQQVSPDIKDMIRRKINSYLHCHLDLTPQQSRQMYVSKKLKQLLPKDFSEYNSLPQLLKDEKAVYHLYKQKIDRNMDEAQYFFFKVLSLAMDYECRISAKELDHESSVMIDALLFFCWSLLEAGADKAVFYFATTAVQFCQLYKVLHPIGEFLLITAKIARKHFKYKQSILMLKKALQYNWWRDSSRSDLLQNQFKDWLAISSPDQVQPYYQKFQVARVFRLAAENKTNRTHHSKDVELATFRDMFQSFLEHYNIKVEMKNYDIVYRKHRESNRQKADDLQIQIYNQLSYNFLQLNQKQQSKIFAQKYESGYLEPQGSKVIALSFELIHSVQKRLTGWHRVSRKAFELLFFADIFDLVKGHRASMRSIDQDDILRIFKINYQKTFANFLGKDLFSYEIPLPLEIRRDIARMKKKGEGRKFIVKQRSVSQMSKQPAQVLQNKYSSNNKVDQKILLNFRGVGVSRLKLLNILNRFLQAAKQRQKQGSFEEIVWSGQI